MTNDNGAAVTVTAHHAPDLRVSIGSLELANPVMPASGCFGPELGRIIDVRRIGATVTKTVFATPRGGNPSPRLTEVAAGMVNSVGIPSRGPAGYLASQHPAYRDLGVPVIVSIGGHRVGEYARVVEGIEDCGDAYELNVSCPNLDRDGVDIGADPIAIRDVVSDVRRTTSRPLIVKLPVMVASIADCARAAQDAGADAVCIANSVPALPLDPQRLTPVLGNTIGGLTGPGIRPIVLRLVWLAARAVDIPVVACGGIETVADALEYFAVGASAVQVGTASFSRPTALVDVADDLEQLCAGSGVADIRELVAARSAA